MYSLKLLSSGGCLLGSADDVLRGQVYVTPVTLRLCRVAGWEICATSITSTCYLARVTRFPRSEIWNMNFKGYAIRHRFGSLRILINPYPRRDICAQMILSCVCIIRTLVENQNATQNAVKKEVFPGFHRNVSHYRNTIHQDRG